MDDSTLRSNPGKTWIGSFLLGVAAIVTASIAFTETVWNRFIWQYFWGPVYADAHDAVCAIKASGETSLISPAESARCAVTGSESVIAEPGYTIVSEIGYMLIILYFLIGVYLLLRRLDIGLNRELVVALVPFMLFGGALRVVEDVTDKATEVGVEPIVGYPLNTLFISPIIYFTVFAVALAALLVSIDVADRDLVASAEWALGGIGTAVLLLTVGYLLVLGLTVEYVGFYPQVVVLTVGLASVFAYGLYVLAERFAPEINRGTGYVGLVVLWAQAIDGVANVLMADWIYAIGLPRTIKYSPKHPANEIIISVTETVLPASLIGALGSSWPFLLVKLAVPLALVWLFTEEFIQKNPSYSYLLLIAVSAVGLGPGSRDMMRAALGI